MTNPRPKVLVVDDDDLNLRTMRRAFRRELEMEFASSGAAALVLVETRAFDVALVDYCMPHMNGLDLAYRLHADHPRMAVIMLTAHFDLHDVREALRSGIVAGLVTKPCDKEHLLRRIHDACPGISIPPQSGPMPGALDR